MIRRLEFPVFIYLQLLVFILLIVVGVPVWLLQQKSIIGYSLVINKAYVMQCNDRLV